MRVLGISGSLRRDSHNTALLRAAAATLPPGVEFELWEGLKAVPPYDADDDVRGPRPWVLRSLADAIAEADVVLFATPEYNHSIPGQLKNALDWLSRPLAASPLRDKTVGVIGASTGLFGAVWAQAELRKVLGAVGARVLDEELPVGLAGDAFSADGRLTDPELEQALAALVAELVGEPALLGERVGGEPDGQLAIDHPRADGAEDLAQVGLGPHRAEQAGARAHDRDGLALQRARLERPREPVQRVLELAGDRVVVLRRGEQDDVGLVDGVGQRAEHPRARLARVVVAVVGRHGLQALPHLQLGSG